MTDLTRARGGRGAPREREERENRTAYGNRAAAFCGRLGYDPPPEVVMGAYRDKHISAVEVAGYGLAHLLPTPPDKATPSGPSPSDSGTLQTRERPRIDHGEDESGQKKEWVSVGQEMALSCAGVAGLPLDMRVWLAALGRTNRIGHAEFSAGELLAKVAGVDIHTGEIAPVSRDALYKAIGRLKNAGMLLPESRPRCLVLPEWAFQKAVGRGRCVEHGLSD